MSAHDPNTPAKRGPSGRGIVIWIAVIVVLAAIGGTIYFYPSGTPLQPADINGVPQTQTQPPPNNP